MDLKSLSPFSRHHTHLRKSEPFEAMRHEINHLFDLSPFHNFNMGGIKVDMRENKDGITVSAELPGVKEEDVFVSLTKDLLSIQGEKKVEKEEKGESYYMTERSFGSFSRTLRLPYDVEAAKVNAEFDDGILTIKIPAPKTRIEKEKRIAIKKKKK
ncbi:MAG: hypothetical protein ACD_16C00211G0002 [uncultured bacterium]|nr:MAG: hypothetical protein ACD_16C00211G0002 [uncultured bacterium]OFW70082.1 MAG: hypothetical protein A2X70_02760 [Alphaproteobacteria bacterium GWC2_42_16]OFW74582.1 MAG: hypothetical protein A2Z80_04155 [Alphaproteobacteria bacterium GWA2_41_27]OFW84854.1 MAG: hypothetical protein A3E50_02350 [Alphaproteobacteria bacterium RIFCSPHIGHO2_12_FULL_42_100]OFW86579.1 MAG: hypothetical protein A2W06_07005 [Alphaproteobacteria bacterium RBG_16_42_14]OFW91838.1 MAG: hypothetical protein A2W46_078